MRFAILALAAATGLALHPGLGEGDAPAAPHDQLPEQAQQPPGQQRERAQQPPGQQRERAQQPPGQQRERARPQDRRPEQAQRPARDRDREPAAAPGRPGPPAHARARRGGPAPDLELFNRGLVERVVQARSRRHGQAPALQVRRVDDEVRLVGADGRVFLALREATLDRLGYWRAAVVPAVGAVAVAPAARTRYPDLRGDPPRNGAPAFCRSGEGHPVWGRDWCLAKGFGLGDGTRAWGVARTIEDVIFGRPDTRRRTLEPDRLASLLGEVAFGRLALQAMVLGGTDPLTGRWLGEAEGPVVLRVSSGPTPVAELVDYDRDGRVDAILFNLGE
jgi:hypothetical protein